MIPAENNTQRIPRDAAPTQPTGEDQERQAIAIIGLAFRFPGDLASPNWLRQFPEHQVVLTCADSDAGAESPGGAAQTAMLIYRQLFPSGLSPSFMRTLTCMTT
ncbi:hypothetical protein [Herbaspirillum sp. B65]|uniref:hypothetical protein n=1 Tax=Herbaspirillum sp. B65 TaxID=137708 RepID=UPI0011D294D0|nr:hypothetical protein [Herbaspirillum sp. B65]